MTDLTKTVVLVVIGYGAILLIQKFFEWKQEPALIDIPGTGKQITIDIPTFWVPMQPGDTKDSVTHKYIPEVTVEGSNWILKFKDITANISGLTASYTPKDIKIPISRTLTVAQLVAKLTPIVSATAEPAGWNIKLPKLLIM